MAHALDDGAEQPDVAAARLVDSRVDARQQARERVRHQRTVGRVERLQPIDGRAAAHERHAPVAQAAAGAGHDVGAVEVPVLEGTVPDRFAEPLVGRLDLRPVKNRDLLIAPMTLDQPRERRPFLHRYILETQLLLLLRKVHPTPSVCPPGDVQELQCSCLSAAGRAFAENSPHPGG